MRELRNRYQRHNIQQQQMVHCNETLLENYALDFESAQKDLS